MFLFYCYLLYLEYVLRDRPGAPTQGLVSSGVYSLGWWNSTRAKTEYFSTAAVVPYSSQYNSFVGGTSRLNR